MTLYNTALARPTLYNIGRGPTRRNWPIGADQEVYLARFVTSLGGKAENTRRIYRNGVHHFLAFVHENWPGLPTESLSRETSETWVRFLQTETGYSAATIKSMVTAAKLFCKKLVADDEMDANPFGHGIDLEKAHAPDVAIITTDDFQAMLNAAKRDRATVWGRRDRALMGLLFYGGFRAAELLGIRAEDIDERRETVHIKRGKGGDPRIVGLDYRAMVLLHQYMAARAKHLRGLPPSRRKYLEAGPIWLSRRGMFLGPSGLTGALRTRAQEAGVTVAVYPHAWRHSAATADADGDMSDMLLRHKFGWSATSGMPHRYSRQTERQRAIARSQSIRGGDGVTL